MIKTIDRNSSVSPEVQFDALDELLANSPALREIDSYLDSYLDDIIGAHCDQWLEEAELANEPDALDTLTLFTGDEDTAALVVVEPLPIVKESQVSKESPSRISGLKLKMLAGVALATTLLLSGISIGEKQPERNETISAETQADYPSDTFEQTGQAMNGLPRLEVSQVAASAEDEVLPPPTTPEPEVFLPQPGDIVGVLRLPEELCGEEVQILEYSEQEDIDFINGAIQSGDATIDLLTPDPTPNLGCTPADIREQELEAQSGRNYIRRIERRRPSATTTDNPSGNVSFHQPVAGHATSIETTDPENPIYLSVLPGMKGNAVIYAHGSTYNAGFADLGLLKPGDIVQYEGEDDSFHDYKVVSWDIVPADRADLIYGYTNPDNEYTMSLFMCSDKDGNTGKSSHRYVVRLAKA